VITFGEYAAPFYDWQRCPHVRRLQSEGKTITKNSVDKQRYVMIRHILSDEALCETPMAELRKADLLDYRDRLVGEMGRCRTSQKAFDIVKTICTEALFREEIDRDITVGLGKIQYESVEPGIFTEDEIRMLFADCPGHFVDQYDYTIFLMAASTGMRKGELFALKWQDIDFENGDLVIDAAWKGSELGKPKWEKTRSTVIPGVTLESLARLRGVAFNTADEKFIFSDAVGTVFGGTWWTKRFVNKIEFAIPVGDLRQLFVPGDGFVNEDLRIDHGLGLESHVVPAEEKPDSGKLAEYLVELEMDFSYPLEYCVHQIELVVNCDA